MIYSIYSLGLNLLGYRLLGLTGLGLSFMLGYLFYLTQVFFISKIKYSFAFDSSFIRIFAIQFSLAIVCFIEIKIFAKPYSLIIGVVLILISARLSYLELDKRLGIKAIYANFLEKYIKK
jgi:hypothetical protein